jgi:hypothetical protein
VPSSDISTAPSPPPTSDARPESLPSLPELGSTVKVFAPQSASFAASLKQRLSWTSRGAGAVSGVRWKFSYERYAVYPANDDAGMPAVPGRHTNVAPACGSFFSWRALSR